MKKYVKYLSYVLRHKYYVSVECFKKGLLWRGLVHDISKFRLSEFIPYANYFYGSNKIKGRNSSGYYKPTDTGNAAFDYAWLLHQKRNKHHWQWWILPEDNGGVKILEMPQNYRDEMLCDWIGAGKAQGKSSPSNDYLFETRIWWNANNHKMQLHTNTRKYFENLLK